MSGVMVGNIVAIAALVGIPTVVVLISNWWAKENHKAWVANGSPAAATGSTDNSGMTWWQWMIAIPFALAMLYLLVLSPVLLAWLGQVLGHLFSGL